MTEPAGSQPPAPPSPSPAKPGEVEIMQYPLGTLGAIIGAGLGILAFKWAYQSGLYGPPLIGVLSGLAAGWLARRGGWTVGAITGVVTLVAGVWAQWKFGMVWILDGSFEYFVKHLFGQPAYVLLMHFISIAAAVWLGARK